MEPHPYCHIGANGIGHFISLASKRRGGGRRLLVPGHRRVNQQTEPCTEGWRGWGAPRGAGAGAAGLDLDVRRLLRRLKLARRLADLVTLLGVAHAGREASAAAKRLPSVVRKEAERSQAAWAKLHARVEAV